jgi:hypothetical protein
VGAPWFPGWQQTLQGSTPSARTVAEIWDSENHRWDTAALQEIFDHQTVLEIQQLSETPMGVSGVPDLTIWTETTSGKYSVATCYKSLRSGGMQQQEQPHPFWVGIWSLDILPRI